MFQHALNSLCRVTGRVDPRWKQRHVVLRNGRGLASASRNKDPHDECVTLDRPSHSCDGSTGEAGGSPL